MLQARNIAALEDDRAGGVVYGYEGDRAESTYDAPRPSHDLSVRRVRLLSAARACIDAGGEQKMRGPLQAVVAATGVLRDQATVAEAAQLDVIASLAAQSEGMVRDLIDFIRSTAGGITVSRRRIDLKILCERVIDAFQASHPDHPIVFTSQRHVEGDWDPDAIERLLTKLLLNVVAFGFSRPAARVDLRMLTGAAVLEVWSAGPLPEREVPARLFEPFVSSASTHTRSPAGLGLGLYLALEIARAHGGWMDIQSHDMGTTFRASLPCD
jgi:signal transduction histidine kinase